MSQLLNQKQGFFWACWNDYERTRKRSHYPSTYKTNGNRDQAADLLGIGVRTLYRKLETYQIETSLHQPKLFK